VALRGALCLKTDPNRAQGSSELSGTSEREGAVHRWEVTRAGSVCRRCGETC
jgi:hypothetical protein